jgi:hypothetical protein
VLAVLSGTQVSRHIYRHASRPGWLARQGSVSAGARPHASLSPLLTLLVERGICSGMSLPPRPPVESDLAIHIFVDNPLRGCPCFEPREFSGRW